MAMQKRTVKTEVKNKQAMVEIPVTLLKHLVRVSHNRQATSYLKKAAGQTYKTATPGMNVVEPEVAKKEKVERKGGSQKAETKPTPEAKVKKLAEKATEKKAIDKNFNKS